MPTGERVRYTLSAVIPRNDWREPLTQRSFVERTYQQAISGTDFRLSTAIEIFLAKIVALRYIGFTFFIRYVDDRIALSL